MNKLTKAQVRFMTLLAADPKPNNFAWKSRKDGRIVEAFGPPENWTVFQIQTLTKSGGNRSVITASLEKDEHFDLIDRGFTKACRITPAGRSTSPHLQPGGQR